MTATIHLADDSPLIAAALKESFEKANFQILGTSSNFEDLLAGLKLKCPDVILTDINMPVRRGGGRATLAQFYSDIRSACPDSLIVVLSSLTDKSTMRIMLNILNVDGYIVKDDPMADPDVMPKMIMDLLKGGRKLLSRKAAEFNRNSEYIELTEMEIAIFSMLMQEPDSTHDYLGQELQIKATTVRKHLKNARDKLGVCTTMAAIIALQKQGFLAY